MASPPSSPVHLQIRKLPVTNEEGTSGQVLVKKPSKKIAALVGEDEMSGPPPVQSNPKNRFRNGHASFRLRMLQEQHGTGFEPVDKNKLQPASVPTSPAAGSSRFESIFSDNLSSPQNKRLMLTRTASPPGTPTAKLTDHELLKKKISRTLSHEKKRSAGEGPTENVPLPQRPFKAAHDSFRLRMFQEQHGFEPVVFMTKKRTRDNKSVMSEFKGGDLNKYTAKTYAIQNGNE
ncbi:hypothetical protein TELCIR_08103, partial [Teladorsagia circumcincta]